MRRWRKKLAMAMEWMVSVLMVSVSLYNTGDRAKPITVNRNVVFKPVKTSSKFTFLNKLRTLLCHFALQSPYFSPDKKKEAPHKQAQHGHKQNLRLKKISLEKLVAAPENSDNTQLLPNPCCS